MTKVFISYSHTDETYRKELENHLSVLKRNGYIDTWTDREIIVGENWGTQIAKEIEEAKIILLLVSSDFLASNYCYDIEMKRAIERHNKEEAIVVPIVLRYCDWSNTPFSEIQGLPLNAKPVKDWSDQDQAFLNIVDGIKALLNTLDKTKSQSFSYGLMLSPKEQLSEIYRKVLSAETERDLRMAKFDLENYKKIHPITFDVEELEARIKMGIRYEAFEVNNQEEECYNVPTKRIMYSRRRRFSLTLIVVALLVISLIVYLVVRLFN